ncbi:glucokinase [Marinobacter sp. F4216]|uniref:glucokinase n=1 Tax=Marinobacter sp. F4216 TaxID=2874281 RepID=UPI001CBE4F53|nr:glucokinase [Marinobacter sp. F4216]MBZ2167710.1 glucokinase [Marinobacter sp. F4216]
MSESRYVLVGDVGGTNARFALADTDSGALEAIESLPCSEFSGLEGVIANYLARVGERRVARACLAVAGIVSESPVQMTNNPWSFVVDDVMHRFGWQEFRVINDFSAMALGALQVRDDHQQHVCGGPGDQHAPRLVLGPGTGLGMAGLVPSGDDWIVLSSEGGHVAFAPADEEEFAVQGVLRKRHSRVSVERILSGPGLVNLYQALGVVQGREAPLDSPATILQAAQRSQDLLAVDALNRFCHILGRVAGDAVLTMGSTGGVYLCGGILPRMLDFLLASPFRAGFENKGRMSSLVASTPVTVITDPYTGLRGAAASLSGMAVGHP